MQLVPPNLAKKAGLATPTGQDSTANAAKMLHEGSSCPLKTVEIHPGEQIALTQDVDILQSSGL